jgi:beta-glucosidase
MKKLIQYLRKVAVFLFVVSCGSSQTLIAQTDKPLYLDHTKPVEARVRDLMSRMTLEEKAIFLNHVGPDITRFDIKSDKWNQSLHGVVWNQGPVAARQRTTMFPVSVAMGATWNPKLMTEVASAISDEARAIYNWWHVSPGTFPAGAMKKGLIYRSPVINVLRNPYWGRNEEAYSEDPFLTGRMGVAHVKGLQGNDPKYYKLISTLKHYAVNNVEYGRQGLSAVVSERMLHEYWLPHFKDAIVEGGAQSIMASYNAINGIPSNINKLMLNDILRDQWGFKGFVVSDLGGVKSMVNEHTKGQMTYEDAVAQSVLAGCDFSDVEFMNFLPSAVRQGKLPEAKLDEALYRVMRGRFLLGEFDPFDMNPYSKIPITVIGSEQHLQLALEAAQQAIVLLSNKNNTLPLDKTRIKTIAVIGPQADVFTITGYSGLPMEAITPIQGIKNRMAPGTEVLFTKGSPPPPTSRNPNTPASGANATPLTFDIAGELAKAAEIAGKADVAILYLGTTSQVEREGGDRTSLGLPGNQEELFKTVMAANPKTIVVLMNAGPITMPYVKENAPAIIEGWWNGEQGANAIADVIFGNTNPGGRLPYTVYASESQVPPQDEYDVTKGFTYMYINGKPLFPFGHGLSYTTFNYSKIKISDKKITADGKITVSVDVKNTGKIAGDEVVQLYVHDVIASVKRPTKELRGFERVSLQPGETKTVSITVPAEKLAFYDEKTHGFLVEPGVFKVFVGSSSEDIRLKTQLAVVK